MRTPNQNWPKTHRNQDVSTRNPGFFWISPCFFHLFVGSSMISFFQSEISGFRPPSTDLRSHDGQRSPNRFAKSLAKIGSFFSESLESFLSPKNENKMCQMQLKCTCVYMYISKYVHNYIFNCICRYDIRNYHTYILWSWMAYGACFWKAYLGSTPQAPGTVGNVFLGFLAKNVKILLVTVTVWGNKSNTNLLCHPVILSQCYA